MAPYNINEEASRILQDVLIKDPALNFQPSIKEAAKKVTFTGGDGRPFLPTPMKMSESSAALSALVAASASAIAADRYGIDYQDIEINTDVASLFLESVALPTIDGKPFTSNEKMQAELAKLDLHDQKSASRRYATNIYQTKDGRWYMLHGSMNASPIMEMLGVKNEDAETREEAIEIYKKKVAQWDSKEIERVANEEYRQAGVVCNTPEEFFTSEQGKIMAQEPLWTTRSIPGGGKAWPKSSSSTSDYKPLAGIRIVDFSRVIAAPAISKILAVLGADVIRVSHSKNPDYAATMIDLQTGKRDVDLDVKTPEGKQALSELIAGADVLVDGFRPGAFERLGFTSQSLREINPSLIYVRENCYGFKGPLAYRSGWQQVSDCLVGMSHLQGKFLGLEEAVLPLFHYQTGLVGASAVLQALLARTQQDKTFDIDVSLTQYNIWFYRLGLQTEAVQQEIRQRHPDLVLRHTDDVLEGLTKTHKSLLKTRPDLLKPEYYWEMDGSEWGLDRPIGVLAPAFKMSQSKLEYVTPSGRRGRSKAEWL